MSDDFYISSTGSDANTGLTSGSPKRNLSGATGLMSILPASYSTACKIHFMDEGPFTMPDGTWKLPTALGNAPPVQFIGSVSQDTGAGNGGGGKGTRTIATSGVGTHTIQDNAGGLTADYYRGYFVRFITGAASKAGGAATDSKYTIQTNTGNVISLAHAFENGSTPAAGDTYVIERADAYLDFNNEVRVDASGGTLIAADVYFRGNGGGAEHRLRLMNGAFYVPRCWIYSGGGRCIIDAATLRTCAPYEIYHPVAPYPDPSDGAFGFYGFYQETGDLTIEVGSSMVGCQIARSYDLVAMGAIDCWNCDLVVVNQHDHRVGCSAHYRVTTGNKMRGSASSGGFLHVQEGASVRLEGLSTTDCIDLSNGNNDGALVEMGGHLTMSYVVGSGNKGAGVKCQTGGRITDGSINTGTVTNSVTGAGGDVLDHGAVVTWAQWTAAGVATRNGSRSFVPTDIGSSCRVWLRADLGVTQSNGFVSDWENQAGSALMAKLTESTNKPGYLPTEINGKPAVDFDGTNDKLSGSFGSTIAQATHMFVVVKADALQAATAFSTTGSTNIEQGGVQSDGSLGMWAGASLGTAASIYSANTAFVFEVEFNGSSTKIRKDGTQVASGNGGSAGIDSVLLGSSTGSSAWFNGKIAEYLLFDAVLGSTDAANVRKYLKARYATA